MFRYLSSVLSPRSLVLSGGGGSLSERKDDGAGEDLDFFDVSELPTSSRSVRAFTSDDYDRQLMWNAIISLIDRKVREFEEIKEAQRSRERLEKRLPDYSWLANDPSLKTKKRLSYGERCRLERICERVEPAEWPGVLAAYEARSHKVDDRDQLLSFFLDVVHETVAQRPRKHGIAETLKKYARTGSGLNQVGDSPRGGPSSAIQFFSMRSLRFDGGASPRTPPTSTPRDDAFELADIV